MLSVDALSSSHGEPRKSCERQPIPTSASRRTSCQPVECNNHGQFSNSAVFQWRFRMDFSFEQPKLPRISRRLLDALGLGQFNAARAQFWPNGGPQWDGLAKVKNQQQTGYVLVEAKAHPGETHSTTQASKESLKKINGSLKVTQMHLQIPQKKWTENYYQTANRLAFLYFMNVQLDLPTWLAFINFTDDQSHIPTDLQTFVTHYQELYSEMGLHQAKQLMDRVITVFTPAI